MSKTTAANRAYRNLVSAKDLPLESDRFREGKLPSVFVHFRASRDWTKLEMLDCKGFVSDCMHPGKSWLQQFIHPDDQPQVEKIIRRAIETKRIFILEHRMRRPDGSLAWFYSRAVPVLDENGEIAEWRGATSDATESIEAVDALTEQEAMYRAVVETTGDGFMLINREGRILMVNDTYVHRSGYTREELLTMSIPDIEARESAGEVHNHIGNIISKGRDLFETLHRTKSGAVWPVEISASYLGLGGGLFVAFSRDLTERKALERRIVEAGAIEQERIAREIHDGVGQQFTGISLLVATLTQRLTRAGHADEAALSAEVDNHVQSILNDVRSLVRGLAPVVASATGLNAALSDLAAKTARTTGIDCRYHGSVKITARDEDAAMHLYRIAQEAVNNAVRHANPNRIDLSLESLNGSLVLTIKDDGVGIDASQKNSEGMGLRIMRYRCSTIGGQISIETHERGGTLVRCRV